MPGRSDLLDRARAGGQGARAARRAVPRHAPEGRHRLRAGARCDDAPLRRAADRARSDRHPAHARDDSCSRARAGAAILLSSHLLHLVEEVCTRVIIMDRGRKIADGTVGRARVPPRPGGRRFEPRADLHARHRARRRASGPVDGRAAGMLSVSLYIIACSLKNRVGGGCARLREPRYADLRRSPGSGTRPSRSPAVFTRRCRGGRRPSQSPIDELPSARRRPGQRSPASSSDRRGRRWLSPGGSAAALHPRRSAVPVSRTGLAPDARRLSHARSQFGLLFGSFISALVLPSGRDRCGSASG